MSEEQAAAAEKAAAEQAAAVEKAAAEAPKKEEAAGRWARLRKPSAEPQSDAAPARRLRAPRRALSEEGDAPMARPRRRAGGPKPTATDDNSGPRPTRRRPRRPTPSADGSRWSQVKSESDDVGDE